MADMGAIRVIHPRSALLAWLQDTARHGAVLSC